MRSYNRRDWLHIAGAAAAVTASAPVSSLLGREATKSDSLAMQLYKSLSDEQRQKICLPVDDARRQYISNWWYIHREHRIPETFTREQQELIQTIFDSLHHPEFRAAVNKQVLVDQYGQEKNAPSVGFFGSPEDDSFEFIYTGHHVTRRCNAHTDKGLGFGGAPIFYGHFPKQFNETKDHPGNPYWYQGLAFNEFVEGLSGEQQRQGLVSGQPPRKERPDSVIKKRQEQWPGLACSTLSDDQKGLLRSAVGKMLQMFRPDDVQATLATIEEKKLVDELYISWYDGKYDIGGDKVWDTWQIEGPNMVWYFRGQPHIHAYFHIKA